MPTPQQRSLMQRAQQRQGARNAAGPAFTPKDPRQFIPPSLHDPVDRIVAAGMKLMYAPEMADERKAALASTDPMPKRLADNITGLMLTLDQRARGGLPPEALLPAAVMLLNEAANLMTRAGQKVSQDDYNEAIQILYVQIGKKLGASDDDLMHAAQQASSQAGQTDEPDAGPTDETDTGPDAPPTVPAPNAPPAAPMTAAPGPMSQTPGGVQTLPPQGA